MNRRLTEKNEIKVFILYVMDSINVPLSYDEIMEIVFENGFVGYFDFTQIFGELVEAGSIYIVNATSDNADSGEKIYSVTDKGKVIAENLSHLIPPSVRSKSGASLAKRMGLKIDNLKFYHNTVKKEGKYIFSCRIEESGEDILNLSFATHEKISADKAEKNFSENPEAILRGILAIVSKDINYL